MLRHNCWAPSLPAMGLKAIMIFRAGVSFARRISTYCGMARCSACLRRTGDRPPAGSCAPHIKGTLSSCQTLRLEGFSEIASLHGLLRCPALLCPHEKQKCVQCFGNGGNATVAGTAQFCFHCLQVGGIAGRPNNNANRDRHTARPGCAAATLERKNNNESHNTHRARPWAGRIHGSRPGSVRWPRRSARPRSSIRRPSARGATHGCAGCESRWRT